MVRELTQRQLNLQVLVAGKELLSQCVVEVEGHGGPARVSHRLDPFFMGWLGRPAVVQHARHDHVQSWITGAGRRFFGVCYVFES